MIDTALLFRAAGVSAAVALVALVISAIALGLFFGSAGEAWGPVNDVFIAIALIALILPMIAVDRLAGDQAWPWLRVVTIAGVVGAVVAAVGQLLLVVGVIDLNQSYVTGGIGFIPVLVWIASLIVLALPMGVLPAAVGWLAVGTFALIALGSALVMVTTGPAAWIVWAGVVGVLALWLQNVSATLLSQAVA